MSQFAIPFTATTIRPSTMLLAIALAVLAAPTIAGAQTLPPDVVRTADGAMVRGTIVERTADGTVSLLTLSGEVRTFAAADIEFAGAAPTAAPAPSAAPTPAAAPAPAPAAAAPAVVDDRFEVHFDLAAGDDRTIRVHQVLGSANATVVGSGGAAVIQAYSFGAACALPCSIRVPRGAHRFGLSVDDREPVPAERVVDVDSTESFSATYDDARPRRRRGIGIGAGLLAAGGALSMGGLTASIAEIDCEFDGVRCGAPTPAALYVPGIILAVGGFVSLFVGLVSHDEANFEPMTIHF